MKAIMNHHSLKIVFNTEETEFTVVTKNLDCHTKQYVFLIKHLSSGKILTEHFFSMVIKWLIENDIKLLNIACPMKS